MRISKGFLSQLLCKACLLLQSLTREIMGNINDLQHLTQNCQNLVHKFYGSHFEILPKEFFPTSYKYLNHNTSHFGGYWHRLEEN